MPNELIPERGAWYETDAGEVFAVLSVDLPGGQVDLQYLDGGVDQIDLAGWRSLDLMEVELPENWHGTMDDFLAARRRAP